MPGSEAGRKLCWFGPRAIEALCLAGMGRVTHIFVRECGREGGAIAAQTGARILSLEAARGVRKPGNPEYIEVLAREFLAPLAARGAVDRSALVVAYRASTVLEELAEEHGFEVAVPRARVVDEVDGNLVMQERLTDWGIPRPRALETRHGSLPFEAVVASLGEPFYAKLDLSTSGSGCHLVGDRDSFGRLPAGERMLYLESVPGPSVNFHAVVAASGRVQLFPPSVQLVGLPGCGRTPTTYCGNDFGAISRIPRALVRCAADVVRETGRRLGELGYRGVFGADLAISGTGAYLLDLNPRFQGSTCLLNDVLEMTGERGIAWSHAAACLDGPGFAPGEGAPWPDVAAAHVVLHNCDAVPRRASGRLDVGVHRLSRDGLVRVRDGLGAADIRFPDVEFVATGGVPAPGLVLYPNTQICRLVFRQRIFDPETGALSGLAEDAVAAVNECVFEEQAQGTS